ncbi:MAG TPA: hydroxymethylbilane synthase [Acidimicrobiia bacterium]|nr:hydroxymethylbilane synthase [Acidimicrobiia bacterium]
MSVIRIATRASALALAQARWVAERLRSVDRGVDIDLVEVTTAGDADRVSPVTTLSEVGAFVRAVQAALLDGRADVAVHSCKDLPVSGPDGLATVFPARESPWDVLCGGTLESLPPGAKVGTGSPRRAAQLALLRPDLTVEDIRGNIDTRLGKVDSGELDAIVLAEAGLNRTGRQGQITQRLEVDQMVPAPAQGALAVEYVASGAVGELLRPIDDSSTRAAVQAERALLARTGAGCRAALGALAIVESGSVIMHGFVEDDRGRRRASVPHVDADQASLLLQRELAL